MAIISSDKPKFHLSNYKSRPSHHQNDFVSEKWAKDHNQMLKNFHTFCCSKNIIQLFQKWTNTVGTNFSKVRQCFKVRRTDQVQFVIPSATVHLARNCSMSYGLIRVCFRKIQRLLTEVEHEKSFTRASS